MLTGLSVVCGLDCFAAILQKCWRQQGIFGRWNGRLGSIYIYGYAEDKNTSFNLRGQITRKVITDIKEKQRENIWLS